MTIQQQAQFNNLISHFEARDFRKGDLLLRAGQIAREIYFVRKGALRLYYEKDGVDISAYFFTENMFAGAYDSFITRKASRHAIEAIEDADLLVISYEEFKRLLNEKPELNLFIRQIIEERFVALHDLFTSQILDSPEERYRKLQKERPDLIHRIPQHQIATFIGVTPVSLSRIRKRLSGK